MAKWLAGKTRLRNDLLCVEWDVKHLLTQLNSGIFNVSWQMNTDSKTTEQYLTFVRSRFLISVLVFESRDYELGTGWHWFSLQMLLQLQLHSLGVGGIRRRPQSRTGLIFVFVHDNNTDRWHDMAHVRHVCIMDHERGHKIVLSDCMSRICNGN